ncbi:c-type cytochrome biogenesis protein CcsB [Actinomycetospora lemnae]|uniref:C-type cytochrome biogenesis protein CcsB n=1 Tax=Actinomycetospora lemnae TaxID=3019891 RepID=A0ABT5STC9_9PSEU|nr:c-type cytochrome biogenesis protein CcsB [Actinomycetospora sp. DW7H6]MDD7965946.1 c-type cytochrome biogenesis protein CcsB [Actinomycetospora sp. DW7H6]
MVVDAQLGQFGDLLFGSALAVYVLAMILHAVEHALLRRTGTEEESAARVPVAAGVTGAAARADEGLSAEGAVVAADLDEQDAREADAPARRPRSRAERFGRTGVSLTVLGFGLHLAMLVVRGLAAQRVPWGNMYEFTAAISLVAVGAWLVVLRRRPELRRLGAFVLLPVIVLMFLAGTVLYTQTAPVVPALRSYWLVVHVSAAVIASGILLLAGVASCLYLLRAAHESSGRFAWTSRLPSADVLDRVAYRATAIAFPIWTFAVITGAIWAEAAWGRYWGWDPKETTAFIAWIVYACYLHARSTAGWRGRRAAVINVVGFAVMVFNLFFVNLVVTGLHSYAGVG